LRALIRFIEAVSRIFGYAAAGLVLLLIVLMIYEVIVRYVFSTPTIWGYEVTTWVMGGSFVLAIAYALSTDSHVEPACVAVPTGPVPGRSRLDPADGGRSRQIRAVVLWMAT
jgi:TRAP-type mannitol/chloroaromatic compound transport system permease small subunit